MKTAAYILLFIIVSFSLNGQDTTFYWGNEPTYETDFNRYVIQKKVKNYLVLQSYSKKGGTWIKSDYSDSIVFVNNDLIYFFSLYHNSLYDSISIKIESLANGYKIMENYDNGIIKLIGFSKTNYPFNYSGKVTKYYRNGQKYGDYFYTDNKIDSIQISPLDSAIVQGFIENRNDSLFMKSSEIVRRITQNMNFNLPTENGIISTFHFAICIENNKITKSLIYRKTEFEIDNELLKAIEKANIEGILNNKISGCMIIPLRINLQ